MPEVAKILGLSRASVYEAVRNGQIPSIHLGKRILIPRSAFTRMLNEESHIQ
ncbi:helix-turn-helix domain-containing protein [Chloroflexota bacterium]